MKEQTIRLINFASTIAATVVISLFLQAGMMASGWAQTKTRLSPKAKAFYQLVSGKWAKITDEARLSMTNEQLNIAALQCNSTKNLNIATATNITSISSAVSQKLSKVLVYQNTKKGLRRINFKSRQLLLFPKLKIGKIRNGRDGFEISNTRVKVTISFGKLKQGNKSVPVMIEGKALYLKCPRRTN